MCESALREHVKIGKKCLILTSAMRPKLPFKRKECLSLGGLSLRISRQYLCKIHAALL